MTKISLFPLFLIPNLFVLLITESSSSSTYLFNEIRHLPDQIHLKVYIFFFVSLCLWDWEVVRSLIQLGFSLANRFCVKLTIEAGPIMKCQFLAASCSWFIVFIVDLVSDFPMRVCRWWRILITIIVWTNKKLFLFVEFENLRVVTSKGYNLEGFCLC